jgi:hypothetical protein
MRMKRPKILHKCLTGTATSVQVSNFYLSILFFKNEFPQGAEPNHVV